MNILLSLFNLVENKLIKRKIFVLFLVRFISSLMELLGIAMILPVINVMFEPKKILSIIDNYEVLNFLYITDISKLTFVILLLTLVIYAIKNLFILFVNYFQATIAKEFISEITNKVFSNIVKKKYLYFTGENSTNFIKIIANDSTLLKNNFNHLTNIISESFTIILIFSLLFVAQPYAMVSTIILFTFGSLIFLLLLKKKTKIWSLGRSLYEKKRLKNIRQIINSIRDLKLLNIEKNFLKQFEKDNNNFLNVNRKQEVIITVPKLWIEMLTILAVVSLVYILIFFENYEIIPDTIFPILALYVGASFKLIPSFNKIIAGVQSIRFVSPIIDEFNILLNQKGNDLNQDQLKNEKIIFNKCIKIKDLNFYYNNQDTILENLYLDIVKGEKIGLLGKSGSGKSTLLDIVTGMLDNYEGQIIVDGKNILNGLKSWRNSISYLSQNVVLLEDTIKNNILLGSSIENKKLIENSITKSLLQNLIYLLPEKENTMIGENGIKLSGGEKQRIGVARAFYLKRDLLILDESTNALDIETEEKIINNLWNEFYDKTIIQVSHNPKALIKCDKVYKISDKKLIQI